MQKYIFFAIFITIFLKRGPGMYRIASSFILLVLSFSIGFAQPTTHAWLADDFSSGELKSTWVQTVGKWTVSDEFVSPSGSAEYLALLHSTFIMRSKPYRVEAVLKGKGAGVVFCMEDTRRLGLGHALFLTGSSISTGYFDFLGKYVETRSVDYLLPTGPIRIRVNVDPVKRSYAITVQDREVAVEELRYISGYAGLIASSHGCSFDYVTIEGDSKTDAPSFFVKSNARQIDHLSYIAMSDESLLISNPVVGIVQRISSVGSYINEVPIQGQNAIPRGLCMDDDKWLYVVDGGQNSVRLYNHDMQLERIISSDLNDPRGVAATGGKVYVLDADGIKVFDKKGGFLGAHAKGLFKDPKNLYYDDGNLFVADFGNGQVQVLSAKDFTPSRVIKENLVNPWDVCVDAQTKDVYVADPAVSAVFHYDVSGNFIERIEPITIKGFVSPRGVRVRQNMVYVADFERILGFKKGVLSIRPALRIEK
jgi:hypothetical protein